MNDEKKNISKDDLEEYIKKLSDEITNGEYEKWDSYVTCRSLHHKLKNPKYTLT